MRQTFAQACENYVPQVYPGHITVFAASDRSDADTYNVEPGLGWSTLTSGGIEIYPVPGNHLSLLKEPHVRILGEKLKACIDKAQANSSDQKSNILVWESETPSVK